MRPALRKTRCLLPCRHRTPQDTHFGAQHSPHAFRPRAWPWLETIHRLRQSITRVLVLIELLQAVRVEINLALSQLRLRLRRLFYLLLSCRRPGLSLARRRSAAVGLPSREGDPILTGNDLIARARQPTRRNMQRLRAGTSLHTYTPSLCTCTDARDTSTAPSWPPLGASARAAPSQLVGGSPSSGPRVCRVPAPPAPSVPAPVRPSPSQRHQPVVPTRWAPLLSRLPHPAPLPSPRPAVGLLSLSPRALASRCRRSVPLCAPGTRRRQCVVLTPIPAPPTPVLPH